MAEFSVVRAFAFFDLPDTSTSNVNLPIFGLQGTVTGVSISLYGLTHTNPDDLDFLLTTPDNTRNLSFWSDVGGGTDITRVNVTISDGAATVASNNGALASGIYKPTDYDASETNVNHAGPGGGATFGSAFGGVAPNGVWKLVIRDDLAGDGVGSLASYGMTVTTSSNAVVIAGGTSNDRIDVVATGADSGFYSLNGDMIRFSGVTSFRYNGGNSGDTINGGAFNEIFDGGGGADTMAGFGGNDSYVVDNALDVIVEGAGQGTDNASASVSYVLAGGVSVETLRTVNAAATTAINLVGNELANIVTGNAGNNILNGGGGADTTTGLGGNDSYVVDNALDRIVEGAGQGTDNASASVSYVLAGGVSVETLRTVNAAATTAINLVGNELANIVTGNAGSNVINGGAGKDVLTGGGSNDFFVFSTALNTVSNVDTVADFNVPQDTIQLSDTIFTALAPGTLNANAFRIGAAAADANDRIIYNSATGALSFDSNGNAAGGTTKFAQLASGLALTNADFVVI